MPAHDTDEDLGRTIGRQIRLYRERHDLTQQQLARRANISTDDRLSKFELGKTVPRIAELHRIATTLGVPLRVLVQPDDDETVIGRLQIVIDLFTDIRNRAMTLDSSDWAMLLTGLRAAVHPLQRPDPPPPAGEPSAKPPPRRRKA